MKDLKTKWSNYYNGMAIQNIKNNENLSSDFREYFKSYLDKNEKTFTCQVYCKCYNWSNTFNDKYLVECLFKYVPKYIMVGFLDSIL